MIILKSVQRFISILFISIILYCIMLMINRLSINKYLFCILTSGITITLIWTSSKLCSVLALPAWRLTATNTRHSQSQFKELGHYHQNNHLKSYQAFSGFAFQVWRVKAVDTGQFSITIEKNWTFTAFKPKNSVW